jgi:predicted protein tyrosine phosphatase
VNERGPLPDSYWVVPDRLLAGRCPGVQAPEHVVRAELDVLSRAGIDVFVDLTEGREYGLRPYDRYLAERIEYRHLAIRDFSIPSVEGMTEILDTIDGALERGRNVYVHCYAGIGRTGTVISCFLVRHGMEAREAMRTVTRWRGVRTPQSEEQLEFVLAWRES